MARSPRPIGAPVARSRAASTPLAGRPKPRPELIPADAILAVGAVMAAGEAEHGSRWTTKGSSHHVACAFRHLLRHLAGEPFDVDLYEKGHGRHSHLACVAARALMALHLVNR